jgi:hypothetical protein
MRRLSERQKTIFWLAIVGGILAVLYVSTLQTIPNGSSHYYMIDVGETQIVLNVWGTLHATGYPHYVITGNVLTAVLRTVGVDPVVAPALVSMLWGAVTLVLAYALALHLSGRAWLAALMTLLLGLVRSVWVHFTIAEIYTFGTMLMMVLLCLALWRGQIKGRIYWLALVGGVAVAHHRAFITMIPALLLATSIHFPRERGKLAQTVGVSLLLGLLGFLPYIYLYLRARAGADWVYGQPGTLSGLWDEFIGREASRFIGPPESVDALASNFQIINEVLLTDLTLPGLMIGVVGLLLALRMPRYRLAGATFALLGAVSYVFHVVLYSDVLSALILHVVVSLAFGWLFFAAALLDPTSSEDAGQNNTLPAASIAVMALLLVGAAVTQNYGFVDDLTSDPTGLETVEQVRTAPADSTVMLAWGPRYFAVSFAHAIRDDLTHLDVVDDKADYSRIDGLLVTPEYTRFNQPLPWWEDRLGAPVYPYAAAPGIVALATTPRINDSAPPVLTVADEHLTCERDRLVLDVTWHSGTTPDENLSVFVHALPTLDSPPVAQADSFAPVYGWRPLTTWQAGEQVRDIYTLAVEPAQVAWVRYGMYRTTDSGGFENVHEYELPVVCDV